MQSQQPDQLLQTASAIAQAQLPERTIGLWWLGQASFVIRSASTTIYVDPFLSEYSGRLIPPVLTPQVAPAAELILCTHEHIDHLDPSTLRIMAQTSPNARFVAPTPIVDQLLALDIAEERILGVQPGEEHVLGDVRLIPLPALHALSFPPVVYDFGFTEDSRLYRYLGYVIELAGVRVYHSGDTFVYDGLVEQLRSLAVDIALLPINGRSYFRELQGTAGNMHGQEAADLAAAAAVKLLIPIHYEMFAANLGDPGALVNYVRQYYPELACYLPTHGKVFTYCRTD